MVPSTNKLLFPGRKNHRPSKHGITRFGIYILMQAFIWILVLHLQSITLCTIKCLRRIAKLSSEIATGRRIKCMVTQANLRLNCMVTVTKQHGMIMHHPKRWRREHGKPPTLAYDKARSLTDIDHCFKCYRLYFTGKYRYIPTNHRKSTLKPQGE